MQKKFLFVVIACLALLVFPSVRAGSFSLAPATVYGTTVNVSVSYPTFRSESPADISILISVTFNNETVSAVNITDIRVQLFKLGTDLAEAASDSFPFENEYASAYWGYQNPHKIEKPQAPAATASWSQTLQLTWLRSPSKQADAVLFVKVTLYFIDANGKAIIKYNPQNPLLPNFLWIFYSAEGEAPIVTIQPAEETTQPWLNPQTITIIAVSATAIGIATATIIVTKTKRKKPAT